MIPIFSTKKFNGRALGIYNMIMDRVDMERAMGIPTCMGTLVVIVVMMMLPAHLINAVPGFESVLWILLGAMTGFILGFIRLQLITVYIFNTLRGHRRCLL